MLIMIVWIRKEDFDRVQERLSDQQASRTADDRRRPLVGLVRCVSCGSQLVVQSTRGGRQYYRCRNAMLDIFDVGFCGEGPLRASALEHAVRKLISSPLFVDEGDGGAVGGSS